jgi:hypothetical protein
MTRIRFDEVTIDALRTLIANHDEIAVFEWDSDPARCWSNPQPFPPFSSPTASVLEVATKSELERKLLYRLIEEIKPAPKSSVHLFARKYLDSETDEPGVYLEATNKGNLPIRQLKIEWVYGTNPVMRYRFELPAGEAERPLEAGEMRRYVFPSELTNEMRSVVQSVSPDLYSVKATKDGIEEMAIPGNLWGEFIETIFESK